MCCHSVLVRDRKITGRMLAQHGENCCTMLVCQQMERAQSDRTNTDDDCWGHPTMSSGQHWMIKWFGARGQTGYCFRHSQQFGHCGSVHSVNDNNLYNHKIFARWRPKQLTDEHWWVCVGTWMHFLWYYSSEEDAFMQWVVTNSGTWVHCYEDANKCNIWSRNTLHHTGPRTTELRILPTEWCTPARSWPISHYCTVLCGSSVGVGTQCLQQTQRNSDKLSPASPASYGSRNCWNDSKT